MKKMIIWFKIALCCVSTTLFAETFVAGKDFVELNTPLKKGSPVSVVEFFSYGCPWCYKLESDLQVWRTKQGSAIEFSRIPVIFHDGWDVYAKAYYVLKALNQDKYSHDVFEAIQEKKQTLDTAQNMVTYLAKLGLDKSTLESGLYHSTKIDFEVKQGIDAMAAYSIQGVPALIIGNHYKVDLQMAGSFPRFFEIANYLVTESQKK